MKRGIFLLFLGLIFSGLLGCNNLPFFTPAKKASPAKANPGTVVHGTLVASVNNIPITLEDLEQEISDINAAAEKAKKPEEKITTRDQKVAYLKNQMIRRALLYQEALDRGLDKESDIASILQKNKEQLLLMELGRRETEKIDVSSKEIEEYYDNARKSGKTLLYEIAQPEERRVREIVLPTESDARDILVQILQGGDFAVLAKDHSKSQTAKDGGDLGFITPGKKFVGFDTVAFSAALETGKVSNIFKGPDGYYIIKIEAKHGGGEKSLSEMWDDLKGEITLLKQQQKLEELLGRLSRGAKIEIREGEIK